MVHVALPVTGTFEAWREAARDLHRRAVPPEAVTWSFGDAAADLFSGAEPAGAAPAAAAPALTVPRRFVPLARQAICHADPQRFARLHALLLALQDRPGLLGDRANAEVARIERMASEVRRDRHKMTAFVRFRDVGTEGPRRRFAAWFEPSHHIVELAAPFFADRFGDMDWSILTPGLTAHFNAGRLSFAPGATRPALPEDAAEDLWRTYFANIFNPARVKTRAMQAEMPRKYWKNLPEARLIPELVAGAAARAREMADAAPTLPPARAARIGARLRAAPDAPPPEDGADGLARALQGCRRCPLWRDATQAVPGEGPERAALMIVGEQPGDREDIEGRPFVGPAGALFDRVAGAVGLDRRDAWVTNAVKHFKYTAKGRRRIHQPPNRTEIEHCRWWLDHERALVRPRLILAMGGTAVESLTGHRKDLTRRRGGIETTQDGTPVLITWHPSYLLRLPDAERRAAAEAEFRDDLALAVQMLRDGAAAPA